LLELTPDRIALGITSYVVLLFSLSVHEAAHALAALRLGDQTANREGRVSLNPLVHIDPIGTVLMPALQFLASGIPLLAWAKPTPYQPGHFRRDKSLAYGHMYVATAGPLSNLLLALLFSLGLFIAVRAGASIGPTSPVAAILIVGLQMNVALALFNLLPIPPLDGSKVASWGLPRGLAEQYDRVMEPYGMWILLILLGSGALTAVLGPILSLVMTLLFRVVL
jgi:Zn-dependent protease